jgi:Tol biopolymer transport system component
VLTAPELEAGDPEWSPDGSSIVFSSQPIRAYAAESNRDATAMHLFRIGLDGSGADEYPLEGAVGAPSWTPAGDQILFTFLEGAGDNDPGHGRLYVMDPDGNNVLPVTSTLGTPAWYAVQQPRP